MSRVLVIEDDPAIAELVRLYLAHDGFDVETVADGLAGLHHYEHDAAAFDLVILDLMLPGLDGRGVCRRIRGATGTAAHPDVPIIMLTALDDDRDKIEGLDLGADDYLTKPFNPRELMARVRAVLRRAPSELTSPATVTETVALGRAVLDLPGRRLLLAGGEIALRTKEFDLLAALAARPGVVLTREHLLDTVWSGEFEGDTRTVDVHISRLRDKLASAGAGITIDTVRSVGYRLSAG